MSILSEETKRIMYKIEQRVLQEAPHITHDDVMSMTDAAEALEVTTQAIDGFLCRGMLTTVIDETARTAYGKSRRLVLRQEIQKMIDNRKG